MADPFTLRHMLTHGSGLIDYEDLMPPGATEHEQVHDIDVLHMLEREDRLYFEPGTSYRYSNGAYALLALIVGKEIGRAHVCTPVTNAQLVCRLLLANNKDHKNETKNI